MGKYHPEKPVYPVKELCFGFAKLSLGSFTTEGYFISLRKIIL